jgi:hypothetical protein
LALRKLVNGVALAGAPGPEQRALCAGELLPKDVGGKKKAGKKPKRKAAAAALGNDPKRMRLVDQVVEQQRAIVRD